MNFLALDEIDCASDAFCNIDPQRIPHHVALIMDGNRRWAKKRGVPAIVGHWKGADTLTKMVKVASKMGIGILTVYAFSTENWSRSSEEISGLMQLFKRYLIRQRKSMVKEGIKLSSIGDTSKFPQDVQEVLAESKRMTAAGDQIELVLALNYGGRNDILRAVKKVIAGCDNGTIDRNLLSEKSFSSFLDTAEWPDPDFLIRTSGQYRLSNFLLWQISYAEVYVTDILWPDFSEKNLIDAVLEYQKRERRQGG